MQCQLVTEAGSGLARLHAGYVSQEKNGIPLDREALYSRCRWSWAHLSPQEVAKLPVIMWVSMTASSWDAWLAGPVSKWPAQSSSPKEMPTHGAVITS